MKPHKILLLLIVATCLSYSCAGLRSALWPAAGGAAGAAVGSLAGPIGAVAGAGIGAGLAHTVSENDELRDGTLQGDGAGDREIERLHNQLGVATSSIRSNVDYAAMLERWLRWGACLVAVLWIISHPKGRAAVVSAARFLWQLVPKPSLQSGT